MRERESERVESERDVCWKKLGLDIMWRYGCVNNFFLLFHFDIGPRLNLHGGRVFSSVYVCECVPVRAWMCLAYRDWYMKKAIYIYYNNKKNIPMPIQERTYTHSREHALTKIKTNRVDEYEERKNRSGKKKDVPRKIDKRGKVRMKAKGNKQARE